MSEWAVTMTLYAALGSPQKPYIAKLATHREWIADGRYLRDVTQGDNYFRQGTLGYSNIDKRYEWVTQDAINSNMMIYLAEPGGGVSLPIVVEGAFTDQGILGEEVAGKRVTQRTVFTIMDRDHHRIDFYMTPPGEKERLVDSKAFTRR